MLDNTNRYAKRHGTGQSNGSGGNITIINQRGNSIPLDLNVDSITANKGDIGKLHIHSANIDDANIVYLMSGDGQITRLVGENLHYDEGYIGKLTSDEMTTNKLTVNDLAQIKQLIADYIQSENITTDYLTVNKSAHFFELVVDKIRSVQGTQINTAANCVIDYVEAYNAQDELVELDDANIDYYRCYWRKTDDNGRTIENKWLPNDQALCQTFNIETGVTQNTQNKYYWRLVDNTNVNAGVEAYINFNKNEVKTEPVENYVVTIENFLFTNTENSNQWTDFLVQPQINGSFDVETNEWTITSTQLGLQLRPVLSQNSTSSDEYEYISLSDGTFTFSTDIPTRLNVGFYYDDGTFEFFEASDEYKTEYECVTTNPAGIEAIVINSATIEVYEACNWIDLSNTDKDNPKSGCDDAPSVGDNLAQLGYRWDPDKSSDRASAIIIAAYATPDPDVCPPSYAQYQNINDFSLTSHRGTYMDATGAHIVGVLEGGTTIGEGVTIPVEVEQYKLIGNTAIYKDTNNNFSPTSITFSILHSTSQATQILTTLPTGFSLEVNGVAQSSLVVNSAQTLSIRLKEGNKIWDGVEIEATSVDALNGQNGEWTEYIYRAYTINTPSLPTNGIAWDNMTTTQKSSWVKSQPTLSGNNTYVWQSWRRVTYDSSNNAVYTDNWKSPTRLTGKNGDPGQDGEGEENIFKHYKEELTASQLNQAEHNPYKWGGNLSEADVTSLLTTYNWNQSPQGIDSSYMYEYVSTRRKYLDTDSSSNTYNQMIWSYFSAPVIWSKWGENGQDGDGVKYIFTQSTTALTNIGFENGWPEGATTRSDINNRKIWYDNPMSPTKTGGHVFVSQSKTREEIDGQIYWTEWSTPSIWARWVDDGETGPQGPTGPQGENGESYQLLKLSEVFEVTIDKSSSGVGTLDNVTGAVNTHFRYMIDKVDGDTHHIMTTSELNTEHIQMRLEWDNSVKVNNIEINSLTYIDLTPQTESGTGYGYFDFNKDNLLAYQFTNSYTDYYFLHKNNYTNYMPTKTDVYLVDSGVKYEMENVPLIFKPDHYFKFGDYAFNSLYQGLSGNQDGEFTTTGWSLIHQDWVNVSLGVYNINNVMNGGGYPTSSATEHYIYKTQTDKPSKPSGTSNTGTWSAPSGWSKTPTTPDGSYTYCWISNSVRQRTTSGYSSTWSAWSDPQIISSYTNGGVVFTSSVNSAQLDITANQIKSEVAATYVTDSELSTARSEILQQANVIAAGVYNTNANRYQTASEVQVTANNIALGVYSDIDGKLRNTGINIQDNTISLDSANTTIGGEVYIHEGEMLSDGINKETQIMIGSTSNTTYTGGSVTTTPQVVRTFISGETLKITDLSCGYYNSYTGVWAERISGATFYLKKGTTYQQITTSTSITFTSSTAGEYSFYCTYNNTPANCKLYGWLVGTSSLANVTEICSEGINIANNNNFLQFNTSDKKFEVQTNITGSGSINSSGFGIKVDNGIPKMMYSRQSPGTPISGGSFPNDLNDPTFYPTEAFDSWGTIGTQISIVNCDSTLSYYTIHRDIDMYLFTAPTSNQTFDISGTVNNTTRGLYNGRIIYIKGHPKLTISNGSNQIVLKNQYWNNSGGTSFTMNSSTGYSMIFVLYSGTWIQL